MPVIKLTQSFITTACCPAGKSRIEYCDVEVPGLYVLCRPNGATSTFYLRYKDASGKTCHEKIGRTAELDLATARKQTKELKARISLGADPRGVANARKAVITLVEFFDDHYLPYVKPRKRSWYKDEEVFNLRLRKSFGNKRLNQLTRAEVQSTHTGWKAEGFAAATCNHPVKLLRHALNLAVEWGMLDQNPIARFTLFPEHNQVENILKDDQLKCLVEVLQTDPNRPICLIALFLLSTGARLNEVLKAKWKQIDKANTAWVIPAENSKSKRVRSVPLNPSALAVLDQLKTEDDYEHLFINTRTQLPYANIHKVWERLRKTAGVPHLRLHDLRHGFASFLINSNRTLYEVQHILGHSDPSVTQRYAHLSTKTMQEASNSASLIIQGAMSLPVAKAG
ncbi:MAG: tyrosine-type recombinase/integrase [Steroidobacteraceae bacterium]